jgi:hypothetical protein
LILEWRTAIQERSEEAGKGKGTFYTLCYLFVLSYGNFIAIAHTTIATLHPIDIAKPTGKRIRKDKPKWVN